MPDFKNGYKLFKTSHAFTLNQCYRLHPPGKVKKIIAHKRASTYQKGGFMMNFKLFNRRSFIKLAGVTLSSLTVLGKAKNLFARRVAADEWGREDNIPWYWSPEGYPMHANVDTGNISEGIIRARVDGLWRRFNIIEVNQEFKDWNFAERLQRLENLRAGGPPSFGGAHMPAVVTHGGIKRGDSDFSLNCAFKGMELAPKEEKIQELLDAIEAKFNSSLPDKIQLQIDMYSDPDLWDHSKLVSLEIFTVPPGEPYRVEGYAETHTFRNQMRNPQSTVCFCAKSVFSSFELKTIAHIVHMNDETVNTYERQLVKFANYQRALYHGATMIGGIDVMGVIYHVVEEFNNTPDAGHRGARVA